MKKSIFFILTIALCTSCTRSLKDKAEMYVKREMKLNLDRPYDYEPVQTQIDSVFATVYTDNQAQQAARRIQELQKDYEMIEISLNHEKFAMALHSDGFSTSDREQYRQAKEKLDKLEKKIQKNDSKIKECKELIKERYQTIDESQFIGWGIIHRYRDIHGVNDILIIVDEKFENTLLCISLESKDPQGMIALSEIISDVLSED